jgi:hypothetical protein
MPQKRLFISVKTFDTGRRVKRTSDDADPQITAFDQVLHNQVGAFVVVDDT